MSFELEHEFAENTTLHGISRIFKSSGYLLKLIWSMVFLVAFAFFVWQFHDVISTYFQYNYNTLVEVEHFPSLIFPAVTICNYNRFWESRIDEKYRSYLDFLLGFADQADNYDFNSGDDSSSWRNKNEGIDFNNFNYEEFAIEAGFRLNESLVRCEWRGREDACSADNFTKVFIPEHGICYTFNGGNLVNSKQVSQTLPGIGNGLSLLINIDQKDYTETYKRGHHEAGLKFVVHSTRDPHLVDTLGLAVPPGFHSYASVRQTKYANLPKPHGTCIPDDELDGVYSTKDCLFHCRLDFIVTKCDCRPLGHPGHQNEHRLCSPIEPDNCVKEALQEYRSSDSPSKCNCHTPCIDITYTTTLSMSVFPSEKVSSEYDEKHNDGKLKVDFVPDSFNSDSNSTFFDLGKNLVYLDVFYDELSVTQFKQVPAMTWSALLANLGGQMGLFLGMSAITATEVVEYLVRKIYRMCKRGRPSNNRVVELVST